MARKHRTEHRKEAIRHDIAAMNNYEDELARQRLEDEAERDRVSNAQTQHNVNQDRERARQGVSRNLEPEFIQVVGHNVYTTPYQNILAVENALAAKSNPHRDDERLKVFLQSALLQINGRTAASMHNPAGPNPAVPDQGRPASQQRGSQVNQSQIQQQGVVATTLTSVRDYHDKYLQLSPISILEVLHQERLPDEKTFLLILRVRSVNKSPP